MTLLSINVTCPVCGEGPGILCPHMDKERRDHAKAKSEAAYKEWLGLERAFRGGRG